MKFAAALSWICLVATVAGAPGFAIVRVTDIYRDLPSTAEMQKKLEVQREAILKNERADQFRFLLTELQALEAQLKEIKDRIDSEPGKKLVRDYEIKRQEAETLREEFEEYSNSENKRINKEMVAAMRDSLRSITAAAGRIAEERGLQGVFDVSGNSNTGIPFVLYVGDAPDLTEDVIEMLVEPPSLPQTEQPSVEDGSEIEQ